VKDHTPLITHLPLIYESGLLIGHIDIFNPHADLLKEDRPIDVIFQGPQCYISPSIYSTTQLPTWNYIKVHLKGKVKAIESKDALRDSLIAMTEFLEGTTPQYRLDPNNPRMQKNLEYIKMFKITIEHWEGKFKLSQDKKRSDRLAAREELIKASQTSIRPLLDNIFKT
jgi:transcriptional regulator